jgi:hypothetical protein
MAADHQQLQDISKEEQVKVNGARVGPLKQRQ